MKIYESSEDYLEAILILSKEQPVVRSIDIVNRMGFSKPSISVAMKRLREEGKIKMDQGGFITLTESGREIAEMIYARHLLFSRFLMKIGVEEAKAVDEACHIEHDISQDTFEKIKAWLESTHILDED